MKKIARAQTQQAGLSPKKRLSRLPPGMGMLSETYRMLFLGTAAALPLYVIFVYWKIYQVYRSLDDRARRLGFLWYSFQFQVPMLAKGMNEYLDPGQLPEDARAQIDNVKRQLRFVRTIIVLWVFLVLGFGAAMAFIRKYYS
ncbi:MAG: hypothetical protein AB7I42_27445 [Bradyrhizobium sp.]|uniref:hypothetical protein n=1 Tax=Bradyrhizobium sp. TaxID=376 RepID=UPI003D0EE7DB